ncbi:MAG: transglutaminase family protein [Bryobacter sp.]|jgi:transglutaminase-like putative cysteine protease|nr:transglutaminase family protein [Bryobacter sp. CoA8 C33]
MVYETTHTTRYRYENPVAHCHSEARLTPRILPHQRLLNWSLEVTPRPAAIISRKDYFGNDVNSFAVLEPHQEFSITSRSVVERVAPTGPPPQRLSWEQTRDLLRCCDSAGLLAADEFTHESPFVPLFDELQAFGRAALSPGRPLLEATTALMHQIYREFRYSPAETSIETPLEQVLLEQKGVCQDFSHAMIGVLRAHGLAARYVSGYLRGGAHLEGAQASHAWVSVFLPDWGWVDFDPTNDLLPSAEHLTLAWGRDFGDVTPVKGITIGGGQHQLDVEVRCTSLLSGA